MSVLWTVMPIETVVASAADPEIPVLEELEYQGIRLQVSKVSAAEYQVVRILTTNPEDYLRSDLQPGSILTYRPSLEVLS
ncbi:YlzJ-like family protein [Acetonema longum]|uniref:YlzJ-like protein n=1 Tax=Acetonema longum DSM 6540 TaxID=1009370 RepID=F7NPF1_9FIRM|nr:YlzJ-like family protein [Acetonema longum]EGO62113.1 hypothetical protein ALO_19982 [Acetonema longum DSM 6540]